MHATVLLIALLMQTPAPPATIEGVVIRVDNAEPLSHARVTLSLVSMHDGVAVTNPAAQDHKNAFTDKLGHFVFSGLEPGRYALTAFCDGYVRTQYGQKSQNQPPTMLTLTAGQHLTDIAFKLMPTATITGRVYDSDNLPLANADVDLFKVAYDTNGQKTLLQVQAARTNDLGEYRLFWITPGKYYLNATIGYGGSLSPNQFAGIRTEYAPTYFPGTIDPVSASAINLLPGAELGGMDITLSPSQLFSIRGRIVGTTGGTGNNTPNVSIRPVRPMEGGIFVNSVGMLPDGSFEARDVAPGSYYVIGRSAPPGSGLAMTGYTTVEVKSYDVEGVLLKLSQGVSVQGRIYSEGELPPVRTMVPPGGNMPANNNANNNPLAALRIILRQTDAAGGDSMVLSGVGGGNAAVSSDGTFTMNPVSAGMYQVSVLGLPVDSYMKMVRRDHIDILQDGLTIDGPSDAPLEIVISTKAPRMDGTLVDKAGNPVANTMVVLMPEDRRQSDRYKTSNTDPSGHFTIRGIYPGEYKLFSWDTLEPGQFRDPDFVAPFEALGQRVVFAEGDTQTIQVQLIAVDGPGGLQQD